MNVQALGYAGIGATDLGDWTSFADRLLGMQVIEKAGGSIALRMDDRQQRLFVDRSLEPGSCFFGWEVADRVALDALAARLDNAGVAVRHEGPDLAAQRMVDALISFKDPAGNRIEVFCGAHLAGQVFIPGRAIAGFRTGPLGLGHAVLTVERLDAVASFYQDLLGFRLSDYMLHPFKACFFHINSRHHSLALIESSSNGIHHLMIELMSLDDVGQGLDLAAAETDRIGVTLGRHTNDYMTSFYMKTPSSFMIEYGWGGRQIDPEQWRACELAQGPSLWGHERYWLSEQARNEARELRMQAAASGSRAPVQVSEGYYQLVNDRKDCR